jgi:hypothetical protein
MSISLINPVKYVFDVLFSLQLGIGDGQCELRPSDTSLLAQVRTCNGGGYE